MPEFKDLIKFIKIEVNKSLKKGKIRKKLNPSHFHFQPQYSKNLILQTARSPQNRHLHLLKKNRSFINSLINEFKTKE